MASQELTGWQVSNDNYSTEPNMSLQGVVGKTSLLLAN